MSKPGWKRAVGWLVACLVVLVLAYIVAGMVVGMRDPHAVEAALAKCREQGKKDGDLRLVHSDVAGDPYGKHAVVVFSEKDGRTIRVTLKRPSYLSGWQATDYLEEAPPAKGD